MDFKYTNHIPTVRVQYAPDAFIVLVHSFSPVRPTHESHPRVSLCAWPYQVSPSRRVHRSAIMKKAPAVEGVHQRVQMTPRSAAQGRALIPRQFGHLMRPPQRTHVAALRDNASVLHRVASVGRRPRQHRDRIAKPRRRELRSRL